MILYSHPASPFGRHVLMAIYVLGLIDQVSVNQVNTHNPEDNIGKINPLGKIPTLNTDGRTYYDSRVILEYLNYIGDNEIFPSENHKKFEHLTKLSRVNGIMDAAVLIVYESRHRPKEMFVESVVGHQRQKIERSLEVINSENFVYSNGVLPTAAEIGLACCLDYLDFRHQLNWREYAPNLEGWISSFSSIVPGYKESYPQSPK